MAINLKGGAFAVEEETNFSLWRKKRRFWHLGNGWSRCEEGRKGNALVQNNDGYYKMQHASMTGEMGDKSRFSFFIRKIDIFCYKNAPDENVDQFYD